MFTPEPWSKASLENPDLLSGSDTKEQRLLALCSAGPHIAGSWAVTQSFPGGQSEDPEPQLHVSSPQALLRVARCRAGAGLSPLRPPDGLLPFSGFLLSVKAVLQVYSHQNSIL